MVTLLRCSHTPQSRTYALGASNHSAHHHKYIKQTEQPTVLHNLMTTESHRTTARATKEAN